MNNCKVCGEILTVKPKKYGERTWFRCSSCFSLSRATHKTECESFINEYDHFTQSQRKQKHAKLREEKDQLIAWIESFKLEFDSVVDFGCCEGHLLEAAQKLGKVKKTIGIDVSLSAIQYCKDLGLTVIHNDFHRLDFERLFAQTKRPLLIFENSLLYSHGPVDLLTSMNEHIPLHSFILIRDQCYLWSTRQVKETLQQTQKITCLPSFIGWQQMASVLGWNVRWIYNRHGEVVLIAEKAGAYGRYKASHWQKTITYLYSNNITVCGEVMTKAWYAYTYLNKLRERIRALYSKRF